ncbi:S8 family serine peptidase [Pseudosporangium ferrugineum]|uniref:Subtilase family protein n=1 Tax=Pseudosporangium ferrugineum TaxID=439699 RepID=A0A2T0RJJ6_9ACTN|nr:S8 family serine peptidase [Pseudosporangium ferrugineum]PRY21328.1 subtilase family protein [Pseudosporangium ferrugineum]
MFVTRSLSRRRAISGTALAAAVVLTVTSGAATGTAATVTRPAAGAARTFTLITGDTVTEAGNGAIGIVRGPGRSAMRFVHHRTADAHYVIPVDAVPLIGSGRVDARLFDLTRLRRDGYDDRGGAELPLLLESKTGPAVAARARVTVARELPTLGLTALRTRAADRGRLWRAAVVDGGTNRVWLDGKRRVADDVSNAQIGVPAAWQKGLTGAGVPVAVLDSGIDASHPDLAAQVAESANFTTDEGIDDHVGHGTHVASILAGTGAASAGKYRGVAPGVRLNVGKVCGSEFCSESAIIAGMQWAAPRSRVINVSIGDWDTPGLDPVEKAVTDLTARYDSLFVVSAGNDGESGNSDGTISSPAGADAALAVAAVDSADRIADFSSRGPRVGDAGLKPDLAAPGVGIVAARAAHSDTDEGPADGYTAMSGTSMAAPHVAAAAAILTGLHPDWTAARRKEALMGSAAWLDGFGVLEQGAGRVDVARAITQEVTVDGGSLSFGRQAWPHSDDKPVTRTVTYRNAGAKPVALALALHPARPGFKLRARTLTVPAGGKASTSLTVDTRVPGPTGVQDGYLLATGPGGVQVRTPYAVDKEVESYTVKLDYRNRDGSPAGDVATMLEGLDVRSSWFELGTVSSMTFRLPRGTYGLAGYVFRGRDTETEADDEASVLGQPALRVDRSMTLTMDAHRARPIRVTVPRRDAGQLWAGIYLRWKKVDSGVDLPSFAMAAIGTVGSRRPAPDFVTVLSGTFARPGRNSPYLYELYLIERGIVPGGYRRAVRDADLATVDAHYSAEASGAVGARSWQGTLGDNPNWTGYSGEATFDMPFRRTEHVSVDRDLRWGTQVVAESEAGASSVYGEPRTYPAGRVTTERWRVGAP